MKRLMYVVLDIASKQFRVKENDYLYVPKLNANIGSYVDNIKVLLISDDTGTKLGKPTLNDVSIKCKIVENIKDKKVIVFKKKRRKGYKKKQGHRQEYTKVFIEKILNKK